MSARSLESSLVNFTHNFRDGLSFGSVALEGHSGDINFEVMFYLRFFVICFVN